MGEESALPVEPIPVAELNVAVKFGPATFNSFVSSDGGRTISRNTLGEVVSGYPPESSVSSSN